MVTSSIRLLAIDIDGTLLNSQFEISPADLAALSRAHQSGIEIILVTGRRHTFAMPIAEMLGFDLWVISSNGAVTRSMQGETFHRDLLPAAIGRELCAAMTEFRGHAVVTFDKETKGALILEGLDQLGASIRRWIEKNMDFIEIIVPIESALISDPVQAMFCGTISRMQEALQVLEASSVRSQVTVLRTEYPVRDLCMIDVLNQGCSKGHAVERWARHRGILRETVMAIGDNYNDVEMLAFAGVPVIMGNASEELRGKGWMVTRSNDENGIAAALETLIFSVKAPV